MDSNAYGSITIDCAAKEALTNKIYEKKCARPSMHDILNCIYNMQQNKHSNNASKLHQAWTNKDNAAFGSAIRERFKKSLLEVAEIEALEEMGYYAAWATECEIAREHYSESVEPSVTTL